GRSSFRPPADRENRDARQVPSPPAAELVAPKPLREESRWKVQAFPSPNIQETALSNETALASQWQPSG
ncbi:MAG: hypothetical protein WD069_10785, partial [Planctomycetales bacterium]